MKELREELMTGASQTTLAHATVRRVQRTCISAECMRTRRGTFSFFPLLRLNNMSPFEMVPWSFLYRMKTEEYQSSGLKLEAGSDGMRNAPVESTTRK